MSEAADVVARVQSQGGTIERVTFYADRTIVKAASGRLIVRGVIASDADRGFVLTHQDEIGALVEMGN